MNAPPRLIPLATLLASASVLLTAVVAAAASVAIGRLVADQKPAWAMFGFELVAIVAGVLGVLIGLGRPRNGQAMALACIAGTVLVASVLGWQGANRALGGVSLTPLLGFRALASVVLGSCALACALSSNRAAWATLLKGVALGGPVVLVLGLMLVPSGRALGATLLNHGVILTMLAAVGGFLILGGLLAASVHIVMHAFELARTPSEARP